MGSRVVSCEGKPAATPARCDLPAAGRGNSVNNTGLVDLVFIVVTSPVTDNGAA
jgi:hypothetical protein